MFKCFLMAALLGLALPLQAKEWVLGRFPVERFRPELKATVEEPVLLLWKEETESPSLELRAGIIKPVLLISLRPQAMPGFDRHLEKLKKDNGRAASLAASLMEEARGRRLQFIGHSRAKGQLDVEFGFFEEGKERKLQRYGKVRGQVQEKGKQLIFKPEQVEFESKSADLLWSLLKGTIKERIEDSIAKNQKKK